MSIANAVAEYLETLEGKTAPLRAIYENVCGYTSSSTPRNSVRRSIYENPERFKSVERGVWMLIGEQACSLIIEGDGRSLESVEDGAIDCIITDHPWDCSKSNKGGNRDFADYDTFRYEQADFDAKARVLKDGAYLVEFLPVETEANWRYLTEIKEMAYASGFRLYATCLWRKAHGGMNTGRTTKGVEQVVIFSKGKPRRLSKKGMPYMTRSMLDFEMDIPIPRNGKAHKAEKPVELYRYLIENLTDEREVILDQFAGSCNCAQAAVGANRFGVVFETCRAYIESAVSRFGATIAGTASTFVEEPVQAAAAIEAPVATCQLAFAL